MSHFTKITTKIRDLDLLKQLLEARGHRVYRNQRVLGFVSPSEQVCDLAVCIGPTPRIGVVATNDGEECEIVCDWDMVPGFENGEAWTASFLQEYAVAKIKKECDRRGFSILDSTTNRHGEVEIMLRKY